MLIAAVVVTVVIFSMLLTVAFLRGSSLTRAECPRCLSHDTVASGGGRQFCRDCELNFDLNLPPEIAKTA